MKYQLYVSKWCPFCIRVVHALDNMDVDVEIRDTAKRQHNDDLKKGGGKTQVPCLRIEDGKNVQWMYESNDIVQYLKGV